MALCTVFLLWISSVMLQEVFTLPMTAQSAVNEPGPAHKRRMKRCSCNNQLDFECHYFCHLDIIWVNTPSKTTVYGLGSPLARRRRSTGRCLCANPNDQTCKGFCMHSSKNEAALHKNPSEPVHKQKVHLKSNIQNNTAPKIVVGKATVGAAHVDVPTFIRNLVRAKNSAMDMGDLSRNKGFRVYKPDYR